MGKIVKAVGLLAEKNFSTGTNGASVAVADYEAYPNMNYMFNLPNATPIGDADRAGNDLDSHLCNTYWDQPELSVQDDVICNFAAKDIAQFLGGTAVRVTVAVGVYDYFVPIMHSKFGNILPARGRVSQLDDAFFLMYGLTGDKLKLSQKAGERAKIDAGFVGTGKWIENPASFTPFPDPVIPQCMDGHKVKVKYTDFDGSTSVPLDGMWLDWALNHDNMLQRNRRRGTDPVQVVSDAYNAEAAYTREIPRGNDTNPYKVDASITLDFPGLADWRKSVAKKVLTNFSIYIPGPKFATVASTDYYYENELVIPKFSFSGITPDKDNGTATEKIAITPLIDNVSNTVLGATGMKGAYYMRYRTGLSTWLGVGT